MSDMNSANKEVQFQPKSTPRQITQVEHPESKVRQLGSSSLSVYSARELAEHAVLEYRDHLERAVKERTAELEAMNERLRREAADHKRTGALLEARSTSLEEVNTALRVLLRQKEREKKDLEDRFISNVKELVLPYVEKIKKGCLGAQQTLCIDIIETNLKEIASPVLQTIKHFNLSPRETQILSLIRDGKKTREIAEIIGVASSSIDTHRNNIRTKLNLSNKKVNLQSYLQSSR
jgi:DNA-binding CsgD family transcriptional regulator